MKPPLCWTCFEGHDLARDHAGKVGALTGHGDELTRPQVEHHAIERELQLLGRPLADRRLDRQLSEGQPLALHVRRRLADDEYLSSLTQSRESQDQTGGLAAQAEAGQRGLVRASSRETR